MPQYMSNFVKLYDRSLLQKWAQVQWSEHKCLTNHTIGWDNSQIITTNRRYHQRQNRNFFGYIH